MDKTKDMSTNLTKRTICWLLISSIFLLLFSSYASPLNNYYWGDAAIFRTLGLGWLNGKVIFKDLFDQKGPYLYLFQMIGLAISKGKIGIFLLEILNLSISLELLYRIGRYIIPSSKKIFISILIFLIFYTATIGEGNMCEEWSLIFTLLPLYLCIKYLKGSNLYHPLLYTLIYGSCFGVLSLLRINNACINIGILLGLSFLYIKNNEIKRLIPNILIFILGMLISITPMILYFYYNNALDDMIYSTFLYNLKYKEVWGEVNLSLIVSNCLKLFPCLICIFFSYRYDKKYKTKFSYIILPSSFITLLTFYNCWGYNHYFTIVLPFIYITTVMSCSLQQKKWTYIILLLLFLPYSVNSIRCLGKNINLNIVYRNDYLYKKVGYINGLPVRNLNDEVNKIMDYIPVNERDSIYCYNLFPYNGILSIANITPIGKYFWLQDNISKVDIKVKQEIHDYLIKNKPLWIIYDYYSKESVLNQVLVDYNIVYTTDNKNMRINLCRRKN